MKCNNASIFIDWKAAFKCLFALCSGSKELPQTYATMHWIETSKQASVIRLLSIGRVTNWPRMVS